MHEFYPSRATTDRSCAALTWRQPQGKDNAEEDNTRTALDARISVDQLILDLYWVDPAVQGKIRTIDIPERIRSRSIVSCPNMGCIALTFMVLGNDRYGEAYRRVGHTTMTTMVHGQVWEEGRPCFAKMPQPPPQKHR